jgi:sphingolipid 4-desaturase/C4-monooxygenase
VWIDIVLAVVIANQRNKMGKGGEMTKSRVDFYRSTTDEPHVGRRKAILKAHPEIEELFVPDSRPVPYVILLVFAQLVAAYLTKYMSWPVYFIVAYAFGGTITHSLSLMNHELSHGNLFKSKKMNEYFAMFCNTGMGIPSATTFKRYHMEHHQFQGVEGKDVDVAMSWEGRFFTTPFFKFFYLILMPLSYAGRPSIINPKSLNSTELTNYAITLFTNALVYKFCGAAGLWYLVASTLLGHGLHPMSGHFIGEHYIYTEGQETYSYYGPLNLLSWNVGYHNEHHDFPRVPGWRLPEVKRIAPEFYDNLASYSSWTGVLYRFVMDDSISPFSRVMRAQKYSASVSKKDD